MKLAALLFLVAPVFAADIVSAYGHLPGGGFRIPIPDSQINWKETAIRVVGKDVEKPTTRLQDLWANKDGIGNTDFNFQVPIPQQLKDRKYYVISQYGLTPLRIRNVVGAIRYNFDPLGTKPEIKKIAFGGNAIFDTIPEDEYVEGAFALITDAAVTSEAVDLPESALTISPEGNATRITLTLSGTRRTARITSPATSKTEAVAVITVGTEPYLFLQWTQERNSCQFTFTLLKLTPTGMEEAGSTAYGCEQ
jgi:hypothetical protein